MGFNTPSFTQLKADFDEVVIGNPDLAPEKAATFDLAYTFTASDSLFIALENLTDETIRHPKRHINTQLCIVIHLIILCSSIYLLLTYCRF